MKSGFVSIVGKTNVGKSSIINSLVGEKVAAIANRPQTTRKAIKAIVNRPDSQIIFIDTPGIHKPQSKLSDAMIETSLTSIQDVDLIVFVVEAFAKEISEEEKIILEKIKKAKKKTILVINKMDLASIAQVARAMELYKNEYEFITIVPMVASKQEDSEILLDEIETNLSEGPLYYDTEEYTDQTMQQLAEEMIREKALKLIRDEVPHGILVEVERMKRRKTMKGEPIYNIEATIYCIRESHKGIIIGKDGEMLKRISTYARQDLEKMLNTKINLKVWVKVKEDWINKDSIVNKFKM